MRRSLFLALLPLAVASGAARADVITVTNGTSFAIPTTLDNATPYFTTINIPVSGTISNVVVGINNFSHTFTADVAVLLVGPTGYATWVFDGIGEGADPGSTAMNVNLIFDQNAAFPPPNFGPTVVSGTYQPVDYSGIDVMPAPAPPPTNPTPPRYPTTFTPFNGTNPNGNWRLYVRDFFAGDGGSIAGGWTLTVTYTPVPEPTALALCGGAAALGLWRLRRRV